MNAMFILLICKIIIVMTHLCVYNRIPIIHVLSTNISLQVRPYRVIKGVLSQEERGERVRGEGRERETEKEGEREG